MRPVPALALSLTLLAPGIALAHDHDVSVDGLDAGDIHPPMRWTSRHEARDARIAIDTEDGKITLLLEDRHVVVQLSDHTMHRVDRELRDSEDEDDDGGPVGDAIRAVVVSGVRSLLDHALQYPVDQLDDVRYRDGRLEFVTRDGDRLFEGIEEDGQPMLESFHDADARAYVAAFHRLQQRRR